MFSLSSYIQVIQRSPYMRFRKYFGPGGTQYIKKVGMLVENFEIDP